MPEANDTRKLPKLRKIMLAKSIFGRSRCDTYRLFSENEIRKDHKFLRQYHRLVKECRKHQILSMQQVLKVETIVIRVKIDTVQI